MGKTSVHERDRRERLVQKEVGGDCETGVIVIGRGLSFMRRTSFFLFWWLSSGIDCEVLPIHTYIGTCLNESFCVRSSLEIHHLTKVLRSCGVRGARYDWSSNAVHMAALERKTLLEHGCTTSKNGFFFVGQVRALERSELTRRSSPKSLSLRRTTVPRC